jgi:hypothetical protein
VLVMEFVQVGTVFKFGFPCRDGQGRVVKLGCSSKVCRSGEF